MKHRLMLVLFGGLLSGCATMSADQCAIADWRALGFQDGARGETLAMAERRAGDCANHGYAMDRHAYEDGRDSGLGQYCTATTAYELGGAGRRYNGVCAEHDEAAFLDAYNQGFEMFTFASAVSETADELQSARNRHAELDSRLQKYWGGYRDEGLTTEEHNEMVLNVWAERKYLLEEAIPYWTYAHRYSQEQLTEYRAKVAVDDPSIGSLRPRAFPGPEPYTGPTREDARQMLQEVFSSLQQ